MEPGDGLHQDHPGCKHCYAERMANRLQAMRNPNYTNAFEVTLQPHMLNHPLQWKKPRRIFVNSMSDLFHEDVPLAYPGSFAVMVQASWHEYQVLTKRADRLLELSPKLPWARQIWQGVSVENEEYSAASTASAGPVRW